MSSTCSGDFAARRCNKAQRRSGASGRPRRDVERVRSTARAASRLDRQSRARHGFWNTGKRCSRSFIKVFPHEYKRVLGVARADSVYAPPTAPPLVAVDGRGAAWVRSPGFSRSNASSRRGASRTSACRIGWRSTSRFRGEAARAGSALHGLRRAILPHRLPGQQPHSRLERPGLQQPLGGGDPAAALDQQLSRVHRAHLSRAVRGGLRARHQSAAGVDQADRAPRSSSGAGTRAGFIPSRRSAPPANGLRLSAAGPPASRRRSSCAAPGTRSLCTRRTTASAACCATGSPTSSWRSTSSTGASTRCAPRASTSS